MSTAIFNAAWAVRLPVRVCSMKSLPFCDRELDVLHVAVVRLELPADRRQLGEDLRHHLFHGRRVEPFAVFARRPVRCCGVRMPATTSSPWALTRNSP